MINCCVPSWIPLTASRPPSEKCILDFLVTTPHFGARDV